MKILRKNNFKKNSVNLYEKPIIIASAPSGFGKTTTLQYLLESIESTSIWFSMYNEEDEQWAWNRVIKLLENEFPKFKTTTDIPTTRKLLDKFIEELFPHLIKPVYIVFDDVSVKSSENILKMCATYSYIYNPLIHFVIMTRDNLSELSSYCFSNHVLTFNALDFIFSKEDISKLCKSRKIDISQKDIHSIYHYTKGWIVAVRLMLESYDETGNLYYFGDLNTLIQQVLFHHFPLTVQEDFLKLSILNTFTMDFIHDLCEDQQTISYIVGLEKENYFIQTVDYDRYQFIPIFKNFLENQLSVSSIDIHKFYQEVGCKYLNIGEPLEAINMFLKCYDYTMIMNIFEQYKEIDFSDIAPQLVIKIFRLLPDQHKNAFPYVYLRWIINCITNFPQLNGIALLEDFKYRIESKLVEGDLSHLYGEYYFIHAFTHFNDIEKMLQDFVLSHQYFKGTISQISSLNMITTFGSCHVSFLYYTRLGQYRNIVDYYNEHIHYLIDISGGLNTGSQHLVKAEYLYETGQYTEVFALTMVAYHEASDRNQICIMISCLFLQGRLAFIQKNKNKYHEVTEKLMHLYQLYDNPILHYEIDCALAYLYIINNEYDKVPKWLKEGEFDSVYILHEAKMMSIIIHGLCLMKERKSIELRNLVQMMDVHNNQQEFAFVTVFSCFFKVIYSLGNTNMQDALVYLKEALFVCEEDHIISLFIELSFSFSQLLELYIPHNDYESELIEEVRSHLETTHVLHKTPIPLTARETKVLALYSRNMTVNEIAETLNISVNTVRTHMKSIYKKLDINSKIAATQYYLDNFEHKKIATVK